MSSPTEGSHLNENARQISSELLPSEKVLEEEAIERAENEERKKCRVPPIVYRDIDPKQELDNLVMLVDATLNADERLSVEELHQYLIQDEGSWALGDGFLLFVERILRDPSVPSKARVHLIRALAASALKDDVVLILHQDRKDHVLMNFAQDIDKHDIAEQEAWGIFMCNLFDCISSSEWLLYISEWTYNNQPISNIRATTKVAVHCLLSSSSNLQNIGSSIIYNLAIKDVKTVVFDDIAVELTMAVLQFFNQGPSEEHLFRTLTALGRFISVSPEISQLVKMVGPDPSIFKGTSARIDELLERL